MKHLLGGVNSQQLLYLGLNAFCFLVYTSLAVFTFSKIRGVRIENRTKQIVAVYTGIFLCNLICS